MGGSGDDCTRRDNVLREGASVVDDDVPHVGQEEEDER